MTTEQAVAEIVKVWTAEVDESWNAGYTEAAEDITQKLQECIPTTADTVPKAQVQGAWRDAANIAYNHLKGHTSP